MTWTKTRKEVKVRPKYLFCPECLKKYSLVTNPMSGSMVIRHQGVPFPPQVCSRQEDIFHHKTTDYLKSGPIGVGKPVISLQPPMCNNCLMEYDDYHILDCRLRVRFRHQESRYGRLEPICESELILPLAHFVVWLT